jgi:hypothetical protein
MAHVDATELIEEIEGSNLIEGPEGVPYSCKLRLAQAAMYFAIGLMEDVAQATDDKNAEAYMIDQVKVLAGSGHGFLSRDFNMDDWIERVEAYENA